MSDSEEELFEIAPDGEGDIYLMGNVTMPHMLKIGYTKNEPKSRASKISNNAGVFMGFHVIASFKCPDMRKFEKHLHDIFTEERVNPKREGFGFICEDGCDVETLIANSKKFKILRDRVLAVFTMMKDAFSNLQEKEVEVVQPISGANMLDVVVRSNKKRTQRVYSTNPKAVAARQNYATNQEYKQKRKDSTARYLANKRAKEDSQT
uniref:Bacteriophage T5 Orf172 DNA-binding domain-containing protein n=1 Tax=viral metagenome TaxID=1070528 RepID=A0A6C0JLR7_9ZZZZ